MSGNHHALMTVAQTITPGTPYGGGYYVGRYHSTLGEYRLIACTTHSNSYIWGPPVNIFGTNGNTYGPYSSDLIAAGWPAGSVPGLSYQAAYYCSGLSSGGYTDWYLPTTLELQILCSARSVLTDIGIYGTYLFWSSNEDTGFPGVSAQVVYSLTGAVSGQIKNWAGQTTWPVRRELYI